MSRVGRWLFLSQGEISKEDTQKIARAERVRRRIPWWEPVKVHRHYGDWAVWSNADHLGGNVRLIIDRGTGLVKAVYGPTPR